VEREEERKEEEQPNRHISQGEEGQVSQ